MKYNYHTHTFRCMHAKGKDEAYVKQAIKNGYEIIGFSDHCAWPFENFRSGMRMSVDEIEDYVSSVRSLQKKYEGKIKILLGYEIEYFPQYMSWMVETLKKYDFDYIILGHHFHEAEELDIYNGKITTDEEYDFYCDEVCKCMETGLISYLAHPDLYVKGAHCMTEKGREIAERIIKKAIETDTILEYNLLGIEHGKNEGKPGYPNKEFWLLAGQIGAKALVGIDAHKPRHYKKESLRNEALEFLTASGLTLVEEIPLKPWLK